MRNTLQPRHPRTNRGHLTFDSPPQHQNHSTSNRHYKPKAHLSLRSKLHMTPPFSEREEISENPEIYFDKRKRKTYMKHIIDNYFPMKQ